MKQMKLFLVALMTVVMGVSVTSCMNGEENTTVPVSGIISIKSTMPYSFQEASGTGLIFVANGVTVNGLSSDATYNDVVFLSAQYDSKTQVVDQNTKKINVDVHFAAKLNSRTSEEVFNTIAADGANLSNRSIIPIGRYSLSPFMYSSNWVIMPTLYYTEKAENISMHSFKLVYYKDEPVVGGNMKLYLYHNSTETASKETLALSPNSVESLRAFNISTILAMYNDKNGAKPQTITVVVQEQKGQSTEIVSGSTDSYTEVSYEVKEYKATK